MKSKTDEKQKAIKKIGFINKSNKKENILREGNEPPTEPIRKSHSNPNVNAWMIVSSAQDYEYSSI